ncbi:MAG TPA: EamA family transporter [Candidatus Avimonoglobus intestinipullorum]|uniref:EamA family transporter n=1 Tax=Candidatus Avimonoglobus intestinipullorum TaxID=2840699 RepID=A0A9D1LUP6_9FIRM|nr:EamA family transporter [Candidatus Avimonoglobus intestinipullorum]
MWIVYAVLSAVFAAATSILAKLGLNGVNSNLATAIRTVVILLMAWGIVFYTGRQTELAALSRKNWVFLIASGVATGLSWLFYFKALQMGDASKVAPIDKCSIVFTLLMAYFILHEEIKIRGWIGLGCITVGTLLLL